jgi:phage-related protein (TIGR01555 family)
MSKAADELAMFDSFFNLVAQLGTQKDKRAHGQFGYREINDAELENMYEFDWLSGKVIDIPVDDATRNWRTITAPSIETQLETIRDAEKEIGVKMVFNEAQKWADLYRGSIAVMMIKGDQDVSEPLNLEAIGVGDLEGLEVFDPTQVSPHIENMNDITLPYFRKPSHYSIDGTHQIHTSRVLKFHGVKLPWKAQARRGYWGSSRLQRFYDALRNSRSVVDSIASMVFEAKLDVISVPSLYQELASPNGMTKIIERFRLADQVKSFNNTLLLDSKEVFQRNNTSFAGLGELMTQYMVQNSAAADIPVTRLFGQSAKGLNATGDGDRENYDNRLQSDQEVKLEPQIEQFDQVFARSVLGRMPDDWKSKWNPLHTASDEERANIEDKNSQRDERYLRNGVVTERIVAAELQENGVYGGIDDEYIEELEELENVEPPPPIPPVIPEGEEQTEEQDPLGLAELEEE